MASTEDVGTTGADMTTFIALLVFTAFVGPALYLARHQEKQMTHTPKSRWEIR